MNGFVCGPVAKIAVTDYVGAGLQQRNHKAGCLAVGVASKKQQWLAIVICVVRIKRSESGVVTCSIRVGGIDVSTREVG